MYNGWSSEFLGASERYLAIQEKASQEKLACLVDARIFLVDAPLTFAHSQLAIRFSESVHTEEASLFQLAGPIVHRALSTLKQLMSANTVDHFKELAEFTSTKENYIKTLVLRSSAQEESGEYKIHLVPYFESHAAACQKRYTDIHGDDQPGGLLGWLGGRETEVDRWKRNNANINDIVTKVWRLPELAEILAKGWASQT